ncbi:hypothetical protein DYI42_14815 [Vannielia litorea]|nr:hypothetical protein [Vannielia litorea]
MVARQRRRPLRTGRCQKARRTPPPQPRPVPPMRKSAPKTRPTRRCPRNLARQIPRQTMTGRPVATATMTRAA